MMKLLYYWSLALCMCWSSIVHADNRRSSVDGLEEVVQMQQALAAAKYDLMNLWIGCELDQLCVCEQKIKLFETTDNLVLQVLIQRDKANDQSRCQLLSEHYIEVCRIPAVTEVNKAIVLCYQQIQQGEFLNDKMLYNEGQTCLAERLQPFLSESNPYAVYLFVDFLSTHPERYPGLLHYYQNQWENLKSGSKYQALEPCFRLMHAQ